MQYGGSTVVYAIMCYTLLYTLGEIIERNNLIKTVMHTTTSPNGVSLTILLISYFNCISIITENKGNNNNNERLGYMLRYLDFNWV